ncbi:MAG: sulfatase-like hydrolase/transferase, partial [Myxococcales bacterium]|nr:sulfatase-like hydrolase/transferase [Myxococcales bacterium]
AAYHERGEDARAELHYRQALRINPDRPAPQLEYANMLRERGELADAALHFARGLRLDPHDALARKRYGLTLLELGRYEEAYAELTRALAEDEGSAEIHAALGAAAGALGRTQEALQHNRAALGLDPQQLSAANNLAWTLATHPSDAIRDAEEAIRIAERAVALTQRQVADPLDTLAAAYAAAQRFEDAVGAEVDAIRMANLADETRKAEGFQARLRLYRAERAYVDGEPASAVEAALPASDLQGAVLILLDTVRADHLSAYGYARPTSPVLEALAKRGVLFEQAISSAPWTLPAVAALLAGDVSARTYDAEHRQLEHSAVESLVRAGYTTAAFTEGGFVSRHFGLDRGFLEFSEEEGAVQLLSGDERRGSGRGGSIQKTFAAAGAWLAKHRDERFFLLVHTYEPHTPYTRRRFAQGLDPGRFGARFTLSDVRALQSGEIEPTPAELRYIEALYDGGLFASDRQIGVLLEQMDRLGLADRTLVVVTSDHGEELGEHFPERTGDHGHALHDSQVRVPLILANPRERYPLRRVAAQVRSIDVLPTVAALLGVHVGDERTGRDLTPLMRGRREPERSAFGGFTKAGPNRAFLRSGGFKYIESTGGEARQPMRTPPPDRQLYALQADPGEQRNLAAEQPERLAVWHESLRRAREASGHGATATGAGAVPDALRERLRSLGYSE